MASQLTDKQKLWCQLFAENMMKDDPLPVREITMEVFDSVKGAGCDKKTTDLLNNPLVSQYIMQICDRYKAEDQYTPDEIISDLVRMAKCNALDFMEWDQKGSVRFRPSSMLTRAQANNIIKIKRTVGKQGSTLELTFPDKLKTIETLMKYHGMLTPDASEEERDLENLTDDVIASQIAQICQSNPGVAKQLLEHIRSGFAAKASAGTGAPAPA